MQQHGKKDGIKLVMVSSGGKLMNLIVESDQLRQIFKRIENH